MAQSWFYQTSEGQQSGPVGSGKLRRLAETGIVRPDTLVRQGDSARWIRAETIRGLFQRSTLAPSLGATSPGPPPGPPPVMRGSTNPVRQEAELARRGRADSDQDRGDGDQHRNGNAALSEFIPNFNADAWDEEAVGAFRRIVEAVNRLRDGLRLRNTGKSRPYSLNLDWDDWDDDVAALLTQIEHAIEQLRAATEDGAPLPPADIVFRFDESIIDDDLVVLARRVQVILNGLRKDQLRREENEEAKRVDEVGDFGETAQRATWWRWLLIPIVAPTGAVLGSFLSGLLQWFGMKMTGGFHEDGWYYLYIMPLINSGVFGWIWCHISTRLAPYGKTITGTVMATILGMLCLFLVFALFNLLDRTTGELIRLILASVFTMIGCVIAVAMAHQEEHPLGR